MSHKKKKKKKKKEGKDYRMVGHTGEAKLFNELFNVL
jgi:hypothetical protein